MVDRRFVDFMYAFIMGTCSLLVWDEIIAIINTVTTWLNVLFHHPRRALAILWSGFWSSWAAVLAVATTFIAFIFDPQLLGYSATRSLLVSAMVLIFTKTCVAEEIHGKKEARRELGTRVWATAIVFALLAAVSFLMSGALENRERGNEANWHNIWTASLWWIHAQGTRQPQVPVPNGSPPQNTVTETTGTQDRVQVEVHDVRKDTVTAAVGHHPPPKPTRTPLQEAIQTITLEARFTCSLKAEAEVPPSTVPFWPMDGDSLLTGPAGTVRLTHTHIVEFRHERENIVVINNFFLSPGESLIGRPVQSVLNYNKLVVPLITVAYGNSLDQMRLLEMTMIINGNKTWYRHFPLNGAYGQDKGSVTLTVDGLDKILSP
jgi:hypothetical protein